jgi:NitT/TauT family transport system substrate-binding protein
MRGKNFGVWLYGNEFEQRAALVKYGMNPDKDVKLVKQNFDMVAFLNGDIDAASAMTYNELAQVLETKNPDTGKLYKPSDLNVFKYSELGTGMLQDGIFVRGDWIKDKANQQRCKVPGDVQGGSTAVTTTGECEHVLPQGRAAEAAAWQVNEVNR